MKLKVSRIDVWAAMIEDKPGGLANKLEALAGAKADLEFVLARRTPEHGAGQGVVFISPVKTTDQEKRAVDLGFTETDALHSVRVEGADTSGMGAKLTRALATAGVNLRGLSATSLGRHFVAYFAFDSETDAEKAVSILDKL